jgi:C1A family cysteine protease
MFVLSLLLLGLVCSRQFTDDDLYASFNQWAMKYRKAYVSLDETAYRFQNFKNSLDRINANNAYVKLRGSGATFGLNKFSDLSPEEFAKTVLMTPFTPETADVKRNNLLTPKISAPATFDWRTKGAVTAVKDQAQCGSCWAFSVTENVESVWILAKGLTNETLPPLAPQQIVDCDDSDMGCDGGNPPTAYQYIVSAGGLDDEKDYPYTAQDGNCAFKSSAVVAKISGFKYATDGDEATMASNLVSWAPLSICVDARYWQDYTSGVMTEWQCDWIVQLDHCVQAVGFDTTASTPFWIVRNSWGTDWGEQGYIRLQYGTNTCGLTDESTSATAA